MVRAPERSQYLRTDPGPAGFLTCDPARFTGTGTMETPVITIVLHYDYGSVSRPSDSNKAGVRNVQCAKHVRLVGRARLLDTVGAAHRELI